MKSGFSSTSDDELADHAKDRFFQAREPTLTKVKLPKLAELLRRGISWLED